MDTVAIDVRLHVTPKLTKMTDPSLGGNPAITSENKGAKLIARRTQFMRSLSIRLDVQTSQSLRCSFAHRALCRISHHFGSWER